MPTKIDYNQHYDACRLVQEVTITAEHIKDYFKEYNIEGKEAEKVLKEFLTFYKSFEKSFLGGNR